MEKKMTSIGGQAIIEGVMMRGPEKIAMAVRKSDGEIVIEEKEAKGIGKWSKVPLIRGVVSFVSSMVIGVQAIMFSAKYFDLEEEEDSKEKEQDAAQIQNEEKRDKKESKSKEKALKKDEKDKIKKEKNEKKDGKTKDKNTSDDTNGLTDTEMYLTVALSLCLSIGLFILLPNFVADIVVPKEMTTLYNVVEHAIKILIFVAYLVLVSQMNDIQRLFQYHGAEHKSIFCYENGEELTPENVKKYSRFHPRCGTSFLLFVIVISIIFFSFLPRFDFFLANMALRLLLMPVVAGISYEIIRFAGKSKNKCVMLLNKPGMWLQRLTTKEPDESQIEVAITSLKAVIPENGESDRW